MEEKITFGRFIVQKRKEQALTQKELAEKLFITESAVSKWERGVSYPDITLVPMLCEALQVTEHELITASDDFSQQELENQAKKFRTIVKTYSWTLYVLYSVAILACFICNLAIQHTLSWFWVVLTGIAVAFSLTSVPMLAQKNRGLYTLGAFYLSLNLLLIVCRIMFGGNWLSITMIAILFGFAVIFLPYVLSYISLPRSLSNHKGLLCFAVDTLLLFALVMIAVFVNGGGAQALAPALIITAFAASLAWAYFLIIRYLPIDGFFKVAICLVLTGIFQFFCNGVINSILEKAPFVMPVVDFQNWHSDATINGNIMLITVFALVMTALIFTIGGVIRTCRPRKNA